MSAAAFIIDTSRFGILPLTKRVIRAVLKRRETPFIEWAPWQVIALIRHYHGADIDEYRARRGKEEGEAAFFYEHDESERLIRRFNMFMFNGAALLFQASMNNGTLTANTGFPTPTLLTNSNTYLYVSDGGPTPLTGSATVTNNSGTVTLTNAATNQIGNHWVFTGDSSSQVYTVIAGAGTGWTISPVYGGASGSGVIVSSIVPESHSQTALQGSTNVANQVADSTFPSNPTTALFNAITNAAGNPIVLTVSGADINPNDIVHVVEVLGNTNANGVWVANPATAGSITLQGSTTNSAYTSGGLVTKRSVLTVQSTFGATAAVFFWNEWGLFNGNGSNKIMMNRKCVGMGSKANGTSTALKIGIGIG
jgi:hypothetical protein